MGRATPQINHKDGNKLFQSTPSVGRATDRVALGIGLCNHFNPRPPWGGRHGLFWICPLMQVHFNPRPPWGGRRYRCGAKQLISCISIHALRGEGDKKIAVYLGKRDFISIHALRGEGDRSVNSASCAVFVFQSTPSVGRATYTDDIKHWLEDDFNPRPPWGGRPAPPFRPARCRRWHFNPRPPWGGRR